MEDEQQDEDDNEDASGRAHQYLFGEPRIVKPPHPHNKSSRRSVVPAHRVDNATSAGGVDSAPQLARKVSVKKSKVKE